MEIRNKEKVTIERETLESIVCDICKKSYPPGWVRGEYKDVETNVKFLDGSSFPDGASGDVVEYDICPDCFEKKLMPALKAMGAEPHRYDY